MDKGAWRTTVHGVAKRQMGLSVYAKKYLALLYFLRECSMFYFLKRFYLAYVLYFLEVAFSDYLGLCHIGNFPQMPSDLWLSVCI